MVIRLCSASSGRRESGDERKRKRRVVEPAAPPLGRIPGGGPSKRERERSVQRRPRADGFSGRKKRGREGSRPDWEVGGLWTLTTEAALVPSPDPSTGAHGEQERERGGGNKREGKVEREREREREREGGTVGEQGGLMPSPASAVLRGEWERQGDSWRENQREIRRGDGWEILFAPLVLLSTPPVLKKKISKLPCNPSSSPPLPPLPRHRRPFPLFFPLPASSQPCPFLLLPSGRREERRLGPPVSGKEEKRTGWR